MANVQNIDDPAVQAQIHQLLCKDEACLAPRMRASVDLALAECHAAGVDAIISETCRVQELQSIYYDCGTTHAQSVFRAWHVYGLAVDIISAARGWDVYPGNRGGDPDWFMEVRLAFEHNGLKGGYAWTTFKDWPHWQWGHCRPTPSDLSYQAYLKGGNPAVWALVLAD